MVAAEEKDLTFKVLDLLRQERAIYGLRNGDYVRYRHHCANKLHRLRQVTGLTSGKGKVYKKPAPVTEATVKDVNHLKLVLFSAERALAHSHELKALAARTRPTPTLKRDQLSWLRRAHKFASSLHALATALSSRMSQRTLAELTIYHLSLRAELAFEKAAFAEALADLAARRRLLGALTSGDSYDQALATEFMDACDPLIRFAAYKLGRAESHDIDGVVGDVDADMMDESVRGFAALLDGVRAEVGADELEAGQRHLADVVFAGEPVAFRHAELVKAMLRVQAVLGRSKEKGGDGTSAGAGGKGWDRVLAALGDAEAVARRLIDDQAATSSGALAGSAKTAESLHFSHQYITYLLLSHRVRRDLALVDTVALDALPADAADFKVPGGRAKVEQAVKALAGLIKLYDTVLQSLGQARSLAIVEEKDGVRNGVAGLEAYMSATRCYHLARLHCIHPTPAYASAVQLLERAVDRIGQAETQLLDPSEPLQEIVVPVSAADVASLRARTQTLELAAKRALFAQRITKPVFFDTAFNYVDLPMDDLLVLAGRKQAAPASTAAAVTAAAGAIVGQVEEVARTAAIEVKKNVLRDKSREATPGPEDESGDGEQGGRPKGWLGGWFGRK